MGPVVSRKAAPYPRNAERTVQPPDRCSYKSKKSPHRALSAAFGEPVPGRCLRPVISRDRAAGPPLAVWCILAAV